MDLASVSILPRSAGKGKATVIRTRIKNRPFLRAANYLLLILALGPIALVAWYVTTYANSAPVGDQWWDVVYIAVKTRLGILTSEDILHITEDIAM